jgi:hypothetical protein
MFPGDIPPAVSTNPDDQLSVQTLAKAYLRSKNTKKFRSTLICVGGLTFPNGVGIQSGIVVAFTNKGLYNGNWIIEKVTLEILGNNLVTKMDLRKCLPIIQTKITTLTPEQIIREDQDASH